MEDDQEMAVQITTMVLQPLNIKEALAHIESLKRIALQVMIKGEKPGDGDYSRLPGTARDTLHIGGTQKFAMSFRLVPTYDVTIRDLGGEHREYDVKTTLAHESGILVGQGLGSCNTKEDKYLYRYVSAECPRCGEEGTVGRSQYPPRNSAPGTPPGWWCNSKKGGCGQDFPLEIGEFKTRRIENSNPAAMYNTCEQMGLKRSFQNAVRYALALGGLFDTEWGPSEPMEPVAPKKSTEAKKSTEMQKKPPRTQPAPHPKGHARGGVPLKSATDGPPLDAYDNEAAPRSGRAKTVVTVSPAWAAKLDGMTERSGAEVNDILKTIGFKGKLLQLPKDLVEAYTKALPPLLEEGQ